jgi:hypothetical protein
MYGCLKIRSIVALGIAFLLPISVGFAQAVAGGRYRVSLPIRAAEP